MYNLLIFPCGSEIGLEIYRSLSHNPSFKLLGASTYPDHGRFVYNNYVETVPHFDDPTFIDHVKDIIKQHEIDFILPAHDGALLKLAENQKQLNAEVVTSSLETCTICRSKLKTYHFFKRKIQVPEVFPREEIDSFPVFLKPEVGQGSRGTHIAHSLEEVQFYINRDPSLLILQYLSGEEATVDCFTNHKGILQYVQGRKRNRIRNGISVNSTQFEDPEIVNLAERINAELAFHGAWFFQVKRDTEGKWCLLEVAPRIASTACVPRIAGVNLVEWSIRDRLKENWKPTPHGYFVETDRALYGQYKLGIDFDVLCIYGLELMDGWNPKLPEIMRVIYHAKLKDIPMIAVADDLQKLATALRLLSINETLFYSVIAFAEVNSELTKFTSPVGLNISNSLINQHLSATKVPIFGLDALEAFV